MRVKLSYRDGSWEEISLESYNTRVWRRSPDLLNARVTLCGVTPRWN